MVVKLTKTRRHYRIDEYYLIDSMDIVNKLKSIEEEKNLEQYQHNITESDDMKRITNHKCKYDIEIVKYFF
jgi:hypothetical protein